MTTMDMSQIKFDPVGMVNELPQRDVPAFLRATIRDKTLTTIVTALNREVLTGDPDRRGEAQEALRRIGFV